MQNELLPQQPSVALVNLNKYAKLFVFAVVAIGASCLSGAANAGQTQIKPASSEASTINWNQQDFKSFNGAGMTGSMHDTNGGNMWLTGGKPKPPYIKYDFGKAVKIDAMQVWNYNEINKLGSAAGRGVKQTNILYSLDGKTWTKLAGTPFTFAQGIGANKPEGPTNLANGKPVNFGGITARYVKFQIISNYGGMFGKEPNSFGLSQVRFYQK
jgi:hypothetical protein